MEIFLNAVGVVLASYLLGSLPTGYLAGRLLKGIDVRNLGSKSVGATNVLRLVGVGPAAAVLLIDLLKGSAAILIAEWLVSGAHLSAIVAIAGITVLVGHSRSIWLGFAGGKSAATGLGVLLAMSWPVGVGAALAFVAIVAIFRFVSLGSMLAALTAMILIFVFGAPISYQVLVVAGGAFVIWLHRANVTRLLAGTEPRLGQART